MGLHSHTVGKPVVIPRTQWGSKEWSTPWRSLNSRAHSRDTRLDKDSGVIIEWRAGRMGPRAYTSHNGSDHKHTRFTSKLSLFPPVMLTSKALAKMKAVLLPSPTFNACHFMDCLFNINFIQIEAQLLHEMHSVWKSFIRKMVMECLMSFSSELVPFPLFICSLFANKGNMCTVGLFVWAKNVTDVKLEDLNI